MITFKEYYILEEGEKLDNVKEWAKRFGLAAALAAAPFAGVQLSKTIGGVDPATEHLMKPETIKAVEDALQQQLQIAQQRGVNPNLPPLTNIQNLHPQATPDAPAPATPPTATEDRNATFQQYRARLVQEEGVRPDVYRDTEGNLTVGIGHLIEPGDRRLFNALFGGRVNYDDLIRGRTELTEPQIDALFEHDLAERMDAAEAAIDNFDNYPWYVQVAIVDGFFRGDLAGSPDTIGHINNEEWDQVAGEYRDNDEYRDSRAQGPRHGVWQRMDRNAGAFERYAEELENRENNR